MTDMMKPESNIYEGNAPYIFISYSHRDFAAIEDITLLFQKNNVRYWYDDGLHSGDDWNMVIAKHLQAATVCLLLLSPNSAESEYVKNELSFAMSHQVPIHTLLLEDFSLPLDIDMMTGRYQRVLMQGAYSTELLNVLPAEIFMPEAGDSATSQQENEHPLFALEQELLERQGTKTWLGKHKTLKYPCLVRVDSIKPSDKAEAQALGVAAAGISHPVFPEIIDTVFLADKMLTYERFRKEQFLDIYLESHSLDEETVLDWSLSMVDALELLYRQNLVLRDFARGSLMVIDEQRIGLSRLQNPYYGLIRFRPETKMYYFEQELQDIAILIAQLCLGKNPHLPLRIIEEKRFDKHFLEKINLVIQKCTKVNGRTQYTDFTQIKEDLTAAKITRNDKKFLEQRRVRLAQYEAQKAKRAMLFTEKKAASPGEILMPATLPQINAERDFGFEETVTLGNAESSGFSASDSAAHIRLMVCATGEIMEFSKTTIRIGRDTSCDMVWTQPYVSRLHTTIRKLPDGTYAVADLNTANGTYIFSEDGNSKRLLPDSEEIVFTGTVIAFGEAKAQIL